MKQKITFISIICLAFFASCTPGRSLFTGGTVTLGMSIEEFTAKFGKPLTQSIFVNENGAHCEELVYSEDIFHNEQMRINSRFLFVDGKLVSQTQDEDFHYKMERERAKEREFIREEIKKAQEKKE